jgi:hypothetical protein
MAIAVFFFLIISVSYGFAAEQDALQISRAIQERHMPQGTVIDPIFASPTSTEIVSYTRGADSATWTGHYLAAEAFRYKVTAAPEALARVRDALNGIRSLRRITGTNLLARCVMSTAWRFANAINTEEAGHGVYTSTLDGKRYYWIGNTSRDQYAGVFFGLAVAYDMVDDADIRATIKGEVTLLLDFLLDHNWAVVMPTGEISTVFWGRDDQQISFLQVGKHINPEKYADLYRERRGAAAVSMSLPITLESLDENSSYFKFNIDYITLYNLIRLEETAKFHKRYLKTYKILRHATADHQNAHFDIIDHALKGEDESRDSQIRAALQEWLQRPRRDAYVDWRTTYLACGSNRACSPLPIVARVPTDFLWQRSPFQLSGGGDGTIETAGIDYILPYWMARYYGVL